VAYRADIEIAVRGAQELKRLQNEIRRSADVANLLPRSFNNINKVLSEAAANFNKVALGTEDASTAAQNYYQANKNLNNALRERVKLLDDIQRAERGAVLSNIKASRAAREASGFGAFSSSIDTPTQKSIRRNREKTGLATAAAETAAAVQKLTERQEEFTTRTDAAAQAAARQTAAFYRQARIAKEVAKLNAAAPAAQLLLAPAAPGAPAMSGGARRRITGSVERLGGARTDDEAQRALRLAQGVKEQVRPLSQIESLYAGIAGEAAKLSRIKALPSSEMLNAAARGLQTIDSIEERRVTRARRVGNKLQQIRNYNGDTGMANAGFGMQGPAVPPSGVPRRSGSGRGGGSGGRLGGGSGGRLGGAISGSIIGGSFPLLFGQGAGAAAGGAAGGLVGGLLGPGGSFAGSLLGTLLGDIASKGKGVQDLADDMGLAAEQTKQLAAAFQEAGRDADKFGAAVQTVRGIGFADEEQIEVIKLVSKLTNDYGGKIDKIAAAYGNFVAKGKVGIADINKFTAQGIPILDELEKKYGKNRDQILALAKAGKITAQDLSDALVEIANRSDEVTKRTTSSWERTFENLKKGAGTSASAVVIILGNLVGVSTNVTGSILEVFSSLYLNLVNGAVNAAAGISDSLASVANNIAAFYKANPLVIPSLRDAAVSGLESFKAGAKGTSKQLRELTKQPAGVGQIQGPQIPGQLPPTGSGGSGRKGAQPPEDRTAQLMRENAALEKVLSADNEIRDALFQGKETRAANVEYAKALVGIELERVNALENANYASEKEEINRAAALKKRGAALQNEDRLRELDAKRAEQELQMQEAVRSSVQTFKDMRTEQELQVQYGKTYSRLLTEGVLPAEATRLANFDKLIAGKLKENEIQTEITKNELAQVGLSGIKIKELEDRLKLLGLIKEAITGEATTGPGAGPTGRERLQTEADRVREGLNTLVDPINMITNAAAGIGDAFATSFKGIVDGSMTAKEGLATFFKSVADMFLDMAAQIIAAWLKMIVLNTVLKIFGGAAGGGFAPLDNTAATSFGFNPGAMTGSLTPGGLFAEGGFVTGPTSAVIGEGGESEYVIPASKMQSAMSRYSRGARGEGVIAGSGGGTEGGTATAAAGPMVVDVRYSVERINDVEYVTASAFQAGMRQAAQQGAAQGEQRTLRRLQQSPGTRKRVGM
jgi:tape measure domain-containing protein